MAAPGYVMVCTAVDGSGECTSQTWLPPPSALPTLTAEQGTELAALVVPVMIIAAGLRIVRDFVTSPSHKES